MFINNKFYEFLILHRVRFSKFQQIVRQVLSFYFTYAPTGKGNSKKCLFKEDLNGIKIPRMA